jgi:Mrp family chromosome partitioning ATPase
MPTLNQSRKTKDMPATQSHRVRNRPKTPPRHENEYYAPLAEEVRRLASEGKRRLLITSSGAGEGKSTVTANLGRALAASGRQSIVIVDADQMRPTQYTHHGLDNQRGLAELLDEIYGFDPNQENPEQFGLGDWLELLSVEGRSGRLAITQDQQAYAIMLLKGMVVSILDEHVPEDRRLGRLLASRGTLGAERLDDALRAQREAQRPLGDVLIGLGLANWEDIRAALRTQFDERLRGILMLRHPTCAFVEAADSYLASAAGRRTNLSDGTGIDEDVRSKFGEFLRQPFLSNQVTAYLKDTPQENLKVLVAGGKVSELKSGREAAAFRSLLHQLGTMFDIVLVDSPPVAVASPTEALARVLDGVLMVVKAEGLDVQIVQRAKEQLVKSGAPILGAILNQAKVDLADPLYYYYGAYPRGGRR